MQFLNAQMRACVCVGGGGVINVLLILMFKVMSPLFNNNKDSFIRQLTLFTRSSQYKSKSESSYVENIYELSLFQCLKMLTQYLMSVVLFICSEIPKWKILIKFKSAFLSNVLLLK